MGFNMYLVMGATGSIGKAVCRRLVQAGESLLLVGRSMEKLGPLHEELRQPIVQTSYESSDQVIASIKEVVPEPRLSGVINCVGSLCLKPLHLTRDDEFRTVMEVNLFTSFVAIKLGVKWMVPEGGSIVLFSSAASEIGLRNHEAIAAAKGGINGMVRSAAATYSAKNIRVNAISLGMVRTEMTRGLWENELALNASLDMHALGRIGDPSKVAGFVHWLVSSENDWMTGQVIGFDGGLSKVTSRKRSGTN